MNTKQYFNEIRGKFQSNSEVLGIITIQQKELKNHLERQALLVFIALFPWSFFVFFFTWLGERINNTEAWIKNPFEYFYKHYLFAIGNKYKIQSDIELGLHNE
ncbi:MAG: hypothetical protein LBG97_00700 [Coriobacteriales bacterium]|nr:hypothetical protein [Coriobacteriales bacterium]